MSTSMIYCQLIIPPFFSSSFLFRLCREMSAEAIKVENLTYVHLSEDASSSSSLSGPALDNISFSLPRGSRTILVGANGGQPESYFSLL